MGCLEISNIKHAWSLVPPDRLRTTCQSLAQLVKVPGVLWLAQGVIFITSALQVPRALSLGPREACVSTRRGCSARSKVSGW
jgi:hypothetical protein